MLLTENDKQECGKITPPWQPDDCDRPAHYDFRGQLLDQYYRPIIPGQPLPVEPKPVVSPVAVTEAAILAEPLADTDEITPAALLREANSMPWGKFQKQAKRILGKTCPAGKQAIIGALTTAISEYEARKAKRSTQHNGMSWDSLTGGEEAKAAETPVPVAAPAAPNAKGSGVDLAAWGRGAKDYLFGDVSKAIRAKYGAQFTERRDARDFLVDQGLVPASQARQDV
jgi:hypothetical protein